jgi:VCBS repeat-containing protein
MTTFSWRQWLSNACLRGSRRTARKRPQSRPARVEGLEDRALLSASPIAVNDPAYSTNEDQPLNGMSVLTNDTDADGDTIDQAVLENDVTNGTLVLNLDGTFTYTPNSNFHGTDSFTYFARDSANDENSDSSATVTITVNAVNDPAVADPFSFSTDEDTQYAGTLTGSDVDGDALVFALDIQSAHGTATVNSDGTFSYVSDADFHGTDSFTFVVNDGTMDSAAVAVTITVNAVNDAPVADALAFSTDEDTQFDGTLTGSDVDGDSLAFALDTRRHTARPR